MNITGTTQKAHQKLVSAIEASLPIIIAEAVAAEVEPIKADRESMRKLLNETQDSARDEVTKYKDIASNQQNEIIGLREELKEERGKIADSAAKIGEQQAQIEELKSDLATASNQIEKTSALYNELLMAVENKTEGETRHQTALRYIQGAEAPKLDPAKEA